jgi:hypothetical protein
MNAVLSETKERRAKYLRQLENDTNSLAVKRNYAEIERVFHGNCSLVQASQRCFGEHTPLLQAADYVGVDVPTVVVTNATISLHIRRAVRMRTYVSEECITSVFRIENQSSRKPARSRWLDILSLLIFDPEDGGDTFLRNVGSHRHYTVLYPRRWQHSAD